MATGSEPTNYSWGLGTTRQASGGIIDYSGVNTAAPIDATATASGTSGNAVAGSVTTSVAADQVNGRADGALCSFHGCLAHLTVTGVAAAAIAAVVAAAATAGSA